MGNELIICGADEVFILDLDQRVDGNPQKVWSWRAAGQSGLPEHMLHKFNSTDECKAVAGGTKILITSSGDGVALINRQTNALEFYATAPNAHSADLLPGQRIAVAASHKEDLPGDRLIVYDLNEPENELCSDELSWGHGAYWDESRNTLWALSNSHIQAYALADWDSPRPSLQRIATIELPERGGHEFNPMPDGSSLLISTSQHCWLFDLDRRNFTPHPDLGETAKIKSIAVHPHSGQLAYVQGEGGNWWAENIHLLHPEDNLHFAGARLYKARWNNSAG